MYIDELEKKIVNAASLVFFIFYYPNTGMGVSNEWSSWFYCFVDIRSLQQHCLSVFDYVGVRYFSDSHKRCKYTETCKVVYLLSRRKCVFIDSSVYQREGFPEYKRATFSLFLANPKYMYIGIKLYHVHANQGQQQRDYGNTHIHFVFHRRWKVLIIFCQISTGMLIVIRHTEWSK